MSLTFLTNSLYSVFLTASFFTSSLKLLKSPGVVCNLPISNLSTSDFQLAKSAFLANFDISTPVAFLSQILLLN